MERNLDATFAALADPTRRAILARLSLGEISVGELAEPFKISAPAISRHPKVLEKANLIERKTDAQWRRLKLNPKGLKTAADWISHYQQFWESQFDALADYLHDLKKLETQTNHTKEDKTHATSSDKRNRK
jgi:DNA-binding transcriptional ArsR family regulator